MRLRRHPKGANAVLRRLLRAPVYLYRWNCGWLLGHRFLLLIHIGRRTGVRRCTVLEIIEYRENGPEAIVISGFGHNAGWLRNIKAVPSPQVVIGSQAFVAAHRFLEEEAAVNTIARYEARNRFVAPIIRWTLSRLLGWRYRSSREDRCRLVRQLPLIALRLGARVPEAAADLARCCVRQTPTGKQ